MSELILLVTGDGPSGAPLLKLTVLSAEMVHPGWLRFTLASSIPDYEDPTVCWYRVPDNAWIVELQEHVTDDDVRDVLHWSKRDLRAEQAAQEAPEVPSGLSRESNPASTERTTP